MGLFSSIVILLKSIFNGCVSTAAHGDLESQNQYIVGYGSLMKTASKNRTYVNTGDNIPIRVTGYSRSWNCKGESTSPSTTYLGVTQKQNGIVYAAMFRLHDAESLEAYDKREHFYVRTEVDPETISLLVPSSPTVKVPPGKYWIYVTKPEYSEFPSKEYPIIQSYVDTFLSGCLEMQKLHSLENFVDECIKTTEGWSNSWINDRLFPRRPFVHEPDSIEIDKLVAKYLPDEFKNIKIE